MGLSELLCKIFESSDILSFVGVCFFGFIVYYQTKKLHKENLNLQEKTLNLESNNLKWSTFTYLSIKSIGIYVAEANKLKETMNYGKYKSIQKEGHIDFDILLFGGNYTFTEEELKSNPVFLKEPDGTKTVRYLPPFNTNREFCDYIYDITLNFTGQSSREMCINEILLNSIELEIGETEQTCNRVEWDAKILKVKPISIKSYHVAINSNYNHEFTIKCRIYYTADNLNILKNPYGLSLILDISYINILGVRTDCSQFISLTENKTNERFSLYSIKDESIGINDIVSLNSNS